MFQMLMPMAGLQGLKDSIINNWLGPVFIAGVAAFALLFIKDRSWTKLLGFVGIAAIVGVLIFSGDALFGNDKGLQKVAKNEATKITPAG